MALLKAPTPPGPKCPAHHHAAGRTTSDKVVEDAIVDVLIDRGCVAERYEIKFERFRLHTFLIRNLTDLNARHVRLSSHRTRARKLRAVQMNPIVPRRMAIGEKIPTALPPSWKAGGFRIGLAG